MGSLLKALLQLFLCMATTMDSECKGVQFFLSSWICNFQVLKTWSISPSPITPPTSSTPQWTIFIKEKLILISFFIHILQLLSYNGKNNVHNVGNFFNFVSFTYTQKNLTIFSLVLLRNWSSEFSCLKKIRIMFHCAVSCRKKHRNF